MGDPSPALRVVRVYFRLPPCPGGMERHIAELSRAQRDQGLEVINLHALGEADGDAVRVGTWAPLSSLRPALLRNAVFYAAAAARARALRSSVPTVLHVHGDWSDFMLSKALAARIGARAVAASVHAELIRGDAVYRAALAHCAPVFATGRAEQARLERLLARPVEHLPSAPLDVFFHTPPQAPTLDVVCVGNAVPVKRLDLVIACARRRPNWRFGVIGEGPLRKELQALAQAGGVRNLTFLGRKSPHDVAQLLARARVFVSTAQSEGTPTAALEAMAMGLPVVLTPSNDFAWLIEPGETGFVTTGWEVDTILDRLDDVLADEARRARMGEAARRRAAPHRWRASAARVTELMQAAVAPEAGP